jgi:hypothetical protein
MSQKKALLNQLAVFHLQNLNKSAIRKELRKNGSVVITMHDGVELKCETMSQVLRCVEFNYKRKQ